jgi:glycosyltransferase involved in cell wall biosynthesis
VVDYGEASTRSLEEFRNAIGPSVVRPGERGPAPVSVVVRTRNRPALVREALESLRAQTARPTQVLVVNDGGASVAGLPAAFAGAFEVILEERPERQGRSSAANRGVSLAGQELVAFLDDDDLCYPDHVERLIRAHRSGPEPVVYSDAVTVVYARREESWEPLHRTLQYSLDFDPDLLLLANYIPLHTLLLPRALFTAAGGFDETLEYSEDWDFLIRLSFATSFRHVRGVTCEYRVFEGPDGDTLHVAAGESAFQRARGEIYRRYADRRTEEGLARVLDRLRAQIAFSSERDGISQGELRYQRESHRRLNLTVARLQAEREEIETERDRLLAENELVHERVAALFASNEEYAQKIVEARTEIERLDGILAQIYSSRTWKLHLLLERLRGR